MTAPTTIKRQRPLGVAVISVFLVLDAIVAVSQLLFDSPYVTRTDTLVEMHEAMPVVVAALAVVRVVAAVGLWMGSRRAWVLAMLIVGIGLILSFAVYWLGDPAYIRMVIDIVIAFYLNQGIVRDYFEGRPPKDAAAVVPTGDPGPQGSRAGGAGAEGSRP
jgi:lysylphosphatidylglycerol synthetase-like protein (DUF2156 family)